eukprot:maker-scaffold25_size650667-snap-gene-3.23 protein:Tk06701 transcript:maker-scaffold25_size650667-snap-gene-3.23-mRNA-1 annotation:"integrin alpha-ps2-like"
MWGVGLIGLWSSLGLVSAFNVDTQHWIAFETPPNDQPRESLFGYSVALLQDRVYIGAPKYQLSGGITQCTYTNQTMGGNTFPCQRIRDRLQKGNVNFLGASMTTSTQGDLFTCAPRFRSEQFVTLQDSTGVCVTHKANQLELGNFFNFGVDSLRRSGYNLLTMMGHSLLMSENNRLVVGAPMARTNDFLWDLERTVGSIIQASPFHLPPADLTPWSSVSRSSVADPHTYDLAGSSIVRGRFYHDGEDGHYAVGAPKAFNVKGAVYLCPDCLTRDTNRGANIKFEKNSVTVEGFQFGSRFGQSICAVDINGDGFDDLVVGAPLFTPRKGVGEGGNVYVFKTNVIGFRTNLILMSQNLQHAEEAGARFGATLASLGDLDGDRLGDFAVGAPFENQGAGAVYIYRGSRNFDLGEPSQKITPEDFPQLSMPTFGFSMTVKDVDGNNRPDVMIGSQGSRHVVLLRAFEVERITPRSAFSIPRKRGIYYLYECDLPIAIQALGSKDLAVAFDIKDWTKFVQFEAIVVKTRLRGKCDPVSQGSGHQLSQVLVSKLNFRYNIIIESSTSVIQTQFEYTNTTIHFIHLYTLANVGPSPTNETFTFNVYTPSNDVLGVHLISHGFKCKAIESSLVTGIHPDYSLATKAMSCQQDSCLIFQCTIEPGFKKGGAVNVVIDMNFQAEKAMLLYPNTYHIVVHTAIRRLGSSNSADFATFFSEFYPVNVSTLAQMAKSYWPYIVGATLGILLLSLTFVAFWKLGLFSKTRLFKRQMDKAELIRPRLPDSSDGGLSD